jgi:hypothetical protein
MVKSSEKKKDWGTMVAPILEYPARNSLQTLDHRQPRESAIKPAVTNLVGEGSCEVNNVSRLLLKPRYPSVMAAANLGSLAMKHWLETAEIQILNPHQLIIATGSKRAEKVGD